MLLWIILMWKIAIIDIGISKAAVYSLTQINVAVYDMSKQSMQTLDQPLFSISHGSVCTAILVENLKTPNDLIAISIADHKSKISTETVCRALRWCMERHINCVSMSIGTENWSEMPALVDITYDLAKSGCKIFNAFSNCNVESFPAIFPWVVGVKYSQSVQNIRVTKDWLFGYNITVGKFKSTTLDTLKKQDHFFESPTNSMATPYALSQILINTPNELSVSAQSKMVQNEETILIKLSGSLQKSQDIVSCFMRNGYNSLLISDHLKTCWKSWTIGISNEWELKNVIKKFQSVSILFLNLNIRFYDLITADMEVDIDGKTFESIFRKILNTFI